MEHKPDLSVELVSKFEIYPELQPLYQLTEPQYNSVINRLASVVHHAVSTLHLSGNTEAAQQIAEQGYEILRDYDDDVAEAVRWCVPQLENQTKLSVRETDKLPPRIEE